LEDVLWVVAGHQKWARLTGFAVMVCQEVMVFGEEVVYWGDDVAALQGHPPLV
jgi:hypothetical protein